jgi:hypothetical protein
MQPSTSMAGDPMGDDPVIELRQYRLHPRRRDELIELFEREFIEPQEAAGMQVIGQFRDLDDPDRFVWLRGFPAMASRAAALAAFYGGPVWQAHRSAANATMVDSDNVLMLRPAALSSGFAPARRVRPGHGVAPLPAGLVVITTYAVAPQAAGDFTAFFERSVQPMLVACGATVLARLVTDPRPNGFPRLPVREGENVLVSCLGFDSLAAYDRHLAALDQAPRWRDGVWLSLARQLAAPTETRRLVPTARSLLRGTAA